jgi:hypothetical protein
MAELSAQTLVMLVQAVDAQIREIKETVNGDLSELEPDTQELLMSYSQAAMELKAYYREAQKSFPGLPPYDKLVSGI